MKTAQRAKAWMAAVGDVLTESVPEPFTFALVLYLPGDPSGALMLAPDPPETVAPVLLKLAGAIEDGTAPLVMVPTRPDA
jgi:hypothetical protein